MWQRNEDSIQNGSVSSERSNKFFSDFSNWKRAEPFTFTSAEVQSARSFSDLWVLITEKKWELYLLKWTHIAVVKRISEEAFKLYCSRIRVWPFVGSRFIYA